MTDAAESYTVFDTDMQIHRINWEPRGVADGAGLPWVVQFNDVGGSAHTFKVSEARPDRSPGIGIVVCHLEAYTP